MRYHTLGEIQRLKYEVEGQQDELKVTENFRGLLGHTRDLSEDRVIWIDAICIFVD
jgi:hypothetical protein